MRSRHRLQLAATNYGVRCVRRGIADAASRGERCRAQHRDVSSDRRWTAGEGQSVNEPRADLLRLELRLSLCLAALKGCALVWFFYLSDAADCVLVPRASRSNVPCVALRSALPEFLRIPFKPRICDNCDVCKRQSDTD